MSEEVIEGWSRDGKRRVAVVRTAIMALVSMPDGLAPAPSKRDPKPRPQPLTRAILIGGQAVVIRGAFGELLAWWAGGPERMPPSVGVPVDDDASDDASDAASGDDDDDA